MMRKCSLDPISDSVSYVSKRRTLLGAGHMNSIKG